jgi:hypothetical protein
MCFETFTSLIFTRHFGVALYFGGGGGGDKREHKGTAYSKKGD